MPSRANHNQRCQVAQVAKFKYGRRHPYPRRKLFLFMSKNFVKILLYLITATNMTDLGCAKPPNKLPANFGVRNSNCTKLKNHETSANRLSTEQCLKPREPSGQARPTNQERERSEGVADFRPANEGERVLKRLPRE